MALWVLSSLALLLSATAAAPVVQTDDGPVQGSHDLLTGTNTFHGVPFAAPPVGTLRWKPPVRPVPWTKAIKTTTTAASCPQFDVVKGFVWGKEDCLYLSVYVPKGCSAETPCPVMQWIYGGAWTIGSNYEFGIYDASAFARKHGVVVVAANYRLDAFGWLALSDLQEESPDHGYGNYGLKDQRAAMQWTQRNIQQFGGNPNKVTIFGESAGGWSVCQHITAPGSNGLFSHAIMESGDCDGPWMILDGLDAKKFGDAFITAAGCDGNGTSASDRTACMRSLPVKDVLQPYISWICFLNKKATDPWCNHSTAMTHSNPLSWPHLLYAPAAENGHWPTPLPPMAPIAGFAAVVDGTQAGLPEVPLRAMLAGKINKSPTGDRISVIMGTNTDEFALFLFAINLVIPDIKLPFREGDMNLVANHLIKYHDHWNQTTADQIIAEYDPAKFKTQASMITTAGTDFCFRCGTRQAARALTAAGIDTYLYLYDFHALLWKDPAGLTCQLTSEFMPCGVHHAAELPLVFGHLDLDLAAKKLSNTIQTYWTNMAKYGTPNGDGAAVEWPLYNQSDDMHLVLAKTVYQDQFLSKEFCDFWDSLPTMGPYPTSK